MNAPRLTKLYIITFILSLLSFESFAQDFTQRSSTTGLHGGIEFGYFAWKVPDLEFDEYQSGVGFRVMARYGINELVSVGVKYLSSFEMNDTYGGPNFSSNAFQFGGRLSLLGTASPWRPYLGVSVLYSTADPWLWYTPDTGGLFQGISSLKGLGTGLEGGINYFISPRAYLDFSVNFINGKYNNNVIAGQDYDEEVDYTILFFGLGFNYQLVY